MSLFYFSGADAILIQVEKTPSEIFSFAKEFRKSKFFLFYLVDSFYSKVDEIDLIKNGFKIVIFANSIIKSSLPSNAKCSKINFRKKSCFGDR